ncbi:DUF1934 domain-containing protein [Rossellomorea aquimaris]|nr:DUF1934 domain-containing protein [Rossellomorea aquimaris]MCA1055064.1 DUF1934 domain-containing protein [Rossellomorea aquimaris]
MTDNSIESTPVKIHLKTNVTIGDDSDAFELVSFGRFYEKDDAFFLKYDEVQEEGTIHTVVKVTDTQALILRSGAVKMRMVFNEWEEMNGSYESELGTLLLKTKTKKLSHTKHLSKAEGDFNLSYELIMQGSSVGDYEMSINFKEEE